jgi:hypothetical protein
LLDGGIPGIADSSLMYVTVQTASDLAANLFSFNLKEDHYEYEFEFECRCRTLTGACDRDINFAGTEVFKLFRGCVFDRRWHLGANAP